MIVEGRIILVAKELGSEWVYQNQEEQLHL